MRKTLLAIAGLLCAATALSAVDVNTATVADLDGINGIGPELSRRILAEREKGAFQDWPDLAARVKGVGGRTAARLSTQGLTVNGAPYPSTGK